LLWKQAIPGAQRIEELLKEGPPQAWQTVVISFFAIDDDAVAEVYQPACTSLALQQNLTKRSCTNLLSQGFIN
jgi:hypothetical protein